MNRPPPPTPAPTPRFARLISVGMKLAGSTIVLILAVAAGVYLALSHTQRENLLQAKERSASAVTQLFVDSCAPGVVFGDETTVQDELTTLGRNDDVEYAAVWSADRAGNLTKRFGELRRRGAVETLDAAPPVPRLARGRGRVVIASPILDRSGITVGATIVAFSLARENAAIANIERNTLLTSAGVAVGLVLLLIVMARLVVVGPLRKLVQAAHELEHGGDGALDIRSSDELGRLARGFRSMAAAIRVREERIRTRNLDMRLVLDNVGQGFLTLELDGTVSAERSRIVDEWFGAPVPGAKFWENLNRLDPAQAEWFEMGWAAIVDDVLPLSLCLEQLPNLVRNDGRTFELAYRPIMDADRLQKVIVVMTEVTARIEGERAEQAQRELMSIFRRLLSDRAALDDFFTETSGLILAIAAPGAADRTLLMRQIHTVKGNAALFGLESVAAFCHQLETELAEGISSIAAPEGLLSQVQREAVGRLWGRALAIRAQLTESGTGGGLEVDHAAYQSFLAQVQAHAPHEVLLREALTWRFERASKRLALIGEQIRELASRLGRAPVEVTRTPTALRLPGQKWSVFWSAFAHMVRNTVDHGIETAEARAALGKPAQAQVTLGIVRQQGHVVVSIGDDGPGIDWTVTATRARERGLPHATRADLEDALFAEGVSARQEATATSGRGVGLGTVRDLVVRLGGHIEIETATGRGTTFRLVLPEDMLSDEVTAAPPRGAARADLGAGVGAGVTCAEAGAELSRDVLGAPFVARPPEPHAA